MTMKEKLNKLLAAKNEQRNQLNATMIESDSKEERAAIGETLAKLAEEIAEIEGMLEDVDQPAEQPAEQQAGADTNDNTDERGMNVMATMDTRQNTDGINKAEARAQKLVDNGRAVIENSEARAVLVSSGTLATPTEVAGINDILGARVSSIVDMVKITDASGMGAYQVAYQISDAEAATTEEGAAYHAGQPTFGFAEIKPETETVLSFISKQARKQTPLAYEGKVRESALVGLRRKAAALITTKLLASDLNTKLTGVALDEKALRKIAFNYGGDESIVGAAVLQLCKADLVTLGDVRGSDKKPVYEITPDAGNPNTGIIKDGGLSVPYVLNSNLTAGTLVYGQMKGFELALFSDYEIGVSEDFAFDKGLLAIRGDVEIGGNVVVNKGFVVATVA